MNGSPLLFAVAAGAANLIGALALTARDRWSARSLQTIVAVSAGFLVSVAFAGLLPEAVAQHGERAALVALAGYVLVHLTQHVLGRHFHFGEETHEVSRFAGVAALAGLLLHTFVDGVAIASGFDVSAQLGLLVFLAIFLHKMPEGLAITSLFLASGASRAQALLAASTLALATVAGAFVTRWVAVVAEYGLAVSAGVTLYVGASNLVPEFQQDRGWRLPLAFVAGCLCYLAAHAVAAG
ncbi:MAG TPA: ZIP family metal transporter [Gemmatimonadaceae bacterium]|nr:ZIP family metal transporter [Gemmatimonadaceae bacterium]